MAKKNNMNENELQINKKLLDKLETKIKEI